MTTLESSHTVIIPQCDLNGQGENVRNTAENMPIPAHLTEENVTTLQSCYLCWRHAEHIYHTTAWRNFPSETRYLCAIHKRAACGLLVIEPAIRAEVERDYEAGLLCEDEPYYSRADEMADLANADYWDEVARGGQVA